MITMAVDDRAPLRLRHRAHLRADALGWAPPFGAAQHVGQEREDEREAQGAHCG